jgi:hypothetical protein
MYEFGAKPNIRNGRGPQDQTIAAHHWIDLFCRDQDPRQQVCSFIAVFFFSFM